jgi:hypothetical protein
MPHPASACKRCRRFVLASGYIRKHGRCEDCAEALGEDFVASLLTFEEKSPDLYRGGHIPEMDLAESMIRDTATPSSTVPAVSWVGMSSSAHPDASPGGSFGWFAHRPRPGIMLSAVLLPIDIEEVPQMERILFESWRKCPFQEDTYFATFVIVEEDREHDRIVYFRKEHTRGYTLHSSPTSQEALAAWLLTGPGLEAYLAHYSMEKVDLYD